MNNYAYLQSPGVPMASLSISPREWLSTGVDQRLALVRAQLRPIAGENNVSYEQRVQKIAQQVHNNVMQAIVRPAGLSKDISGGSSGTGSDSSGSWAQALSAGVGAIGSIASAAIQSGNAAQMQQAQNAMMNRLADLQAQGRSASDAQIQALQQSIAALQAQQGQQPQQQGMSTGTMIALGVGAVAVLGLGAMMIMRPRRNPVLYRKTKRGFRAARFVQARKLR